MTMDWDNTFVQAAIFIGILLAIAGLSQWLVPIVDCWIDPNQLRCIVGS